MSYCWSSCKTDWLRWCISLIKNLRAFVVWGVLLSLSSSSSSFYYKCFCCCCCCCCWRVWCGLSTIAWRGYYTTCGLRYFSKVMGRKSTSFMCPPNYRVCTFNIHLTTPRILCTLIIVYFFVCAYLQKKKLIITITKLFTNILQNNNEIYMYCFSYIIVFVLFILPIWANLKL